MEWREIPTLKGFWVSADGEVKDSDGNMVELKENQNGYKIIQIRMLVHRAVLMAFDGPPLEGKNITRHLDGDRTNNKITNLKWGTQKENMADAMEHGTHVCKSPRQRSWYTSKLTEEQVIEIKTRAANGSELSKDIAKDYPVHVSTVRKIIRGEDWAHIQI